MKKFGIYFASVSGRTRSVAKRLEQKLFPIQVSLFDLRDGGIDSMRDQDVLIFGTPTYGSGGMHYLWQKLFDDVLSELAKSNEKQIALFALGDYKHHPRTFARGLTELYKLLATIGVTPIGQMQYSDIGAPHELKHLLNGNSLPGLVLDEISDRRSTEERISKWVSQIQFQTDVIEVT